MMLEKEKLISLVTLMQKGDNAATNELFKLFYNDLYYFALKTIKDEDLALDVTQESFVEIINTIGNLKEPAAFVIWAKQITYHQCTRYFKKKKDVLVDEDEHGNTIFDTLKEENTEFIPDEALDKEDFKKTILALLDELSQEQRSAIMMFYFDEMSIRQIAEIQGVNENTVKSRLNYAKKNIKASVEEYEKENNVKLHAIPFFPFFKWLFHGQFADGISAPAAQTIAEGITKATNTVISVTNAASTTTAATTTAAASTTTASAVGLGAKISAMPIAVKLISVIIAATVALGGAATAIILSVNNHSEHTWGTWQQTTSGEERVCTECNEKEIREFPAPSEERFSYLSKALQNFPYFESSADLSNVSVKSVFNWMIDFRSEVSVEPIDKGETGVSNELYSTYAISDLDECTRSIFNYTWDYSVLDGENVNMYKCAYNAADKTITVTTLGGWGGPVPYATYKGYTRKDNTHFVVTYDEMDYDDTLLIKNVTIEVELIDGKFIAVAHYSKEEQEREKIFAEYADVFAKFKLFGSRNEEPAGRVLACLIDFRNQFIDPISTETINDGLDALQLYSVSDLDAFTMKYFNTTWDYSILDGTIVGGHYHCSYNAVDKTITVECATGWGGPNLYADYISYSRENDTSFFVYYNTYEDGGNTPIAAGQKIEVELIDGNYVIVTEFLKPSTH